MKIKTVLSQTQSLTLTPQLQQAIKLLQMSALELNSFVTQQAQDNPLLEWQESYSDTPQSSEVEQNYLTNEAAENIWQSDLPSYARANRSNNFDNKSADIFETISSTSSLREHLLSQAAIICSTQDLNLVEILIDGLDERGFYIEDIDAIAKQNSIETQYLQNLLDTLKDCEPIGIFSQNLGECFKAQLENCDSLTESAEKVLNKLHLLENNDLEYLANTVEVSLETCRKVLQNLRKLTATPISEYCPDDNPILIPDLILGRNENGSWQTFLNPEVTPRVIVNSEFYSILNSTKTNNDDRNYIKERYASANWLVRSLQQRFITLVKVAEKIIETQHDFFEKGPEAIKPLTLRDIAQACDVHESTVSRAVRDKYIATPRGIYELKYFFSSHTKNTANIQHSAKSIQQKIKAIIKLESQEKPYSDDSVVKLLKAQGINVARRTVTKYREAIHISSSIERKRQYNMYL